MSDVLLTGLGIGKSFGVCDVDNMNYKELLINPHVLLWADKICLPHELYFSDDILGKEYQLVFELLDQNGIIRRYRAEDYNYDGVFDDFLRQAVIELRELELSDPQNVVSGDRNNVPYETMINGFHYCAPKIASLNAALFLAGEIDANCLMDESEEFYYKRRHLAFFEPQSQENVSVINDVYRELFNIKLPNDSILHEYGTHGGCISCKKKRECNDSYLLEVEKNLSAFLSVRNHDEMRQLRKIVNDIISKSQELTKTDKEKNEYILSEIDKKQLHISAIVNNLFPKIKRIANLVATIRSSMYIGKLVLGNEWSSNLEHSSSHIPSLTSSILEMYTSKNNWINFIDRNNIHC